MEVGCLGYPGASATSQPAPNQMTGNPCNPAVSPHARPTGTHDTELHVHVTVEKREKGGSGNDEVDLAKRSTVATA